MCVQQYCFGSVYVLAVGTACVCRPNVCQTATVTEVQVSSYSFQRPCSSCGSVETP